MQMCGLDTCVNVHEDYWRIKPFVKYSKISEDDGFLTGISDILESEEFARTKSFIHHGSTSCYQHQISVAYYTYRMCKFFKLRAVEAARGALLHDFFLYNWHDLEKSEQRKHPYSHPNVALKNAKMYFELTDMQEDIIKKHMWPLTLVPPKYRETFIVTIADKMCCVMEVLANFFGKKEVS